MRGLGHARQVDEGFTKVLGIADATEVGVGSTHVCALHKTGVVSCWGSKMRGQMGYSMPEPTRPNLAANDPSLLQMTPQTVSGIEQAEQLVVGDFHACVRRRDGAVLCWGWLDFEGHIDDELVRVPGIPSSIRIYAGAAFMCSLGVDRQLYCWGRVTDADGDLHLVSKPQSLFAVPVDANISSGYSGICVGDSCWGKRPGTAQ
jgi:hypothetical protein